MSRGETNPHFSRPRHGHQDHQQPPTPTVPHQEHHGQPPPSLPLGGPPPIQQEDQPYHPRFPLNPQQGDQPYRPHFPRHHQDDQLPHISQVPPREKRGRTSRGGAGKQRDDQPYLPLAAYGGQPQSREKGDRMPPREKREQSPPREKRGQIPREDASKQRDGQPYLPLGAYGGQPQSREKGDQTPSREKGDRMPPREKRDRSPPQEKRDQIPPGGTHIKQEDQPHPASQEHQDQLPHEGSHKQHEDEPYLIPRAYGGWPPRKAHVQHQDQPHQLPHEHHGQKPHRGAPPRVNFQEQSPKPHGSKMLPPPDRHHGHHKKPDHGRRPLNMGEETSQKSKACTWCGIVFCLIFWLVIIIGGLIVLIVYLVFRPQSPHFDVSSVTLNAAYLDLGYLLNADVTMLANFTNPNKRVHVDFSSVIIYLRYGNTLISTQYVEPFSAARNQSRFAAIHMVTSQVQLPLKESQRMMKQMEGNGILLDVLGVFRAKSKLGRILRYSYNLYGHCDIMLTRPPNGVLLKKKCSTKR
ncbi:hypothetical protein TanjilG_05730 [Lupinus angustifolius]|uniref:Late embryogenesis abundant protein LEA-2 subgroup domain-containing protein n=1 Tax=Lupinus angustifolius TaxID=3871 RepID=A0A4P1R3B6_LUPAN|nr:PREDICTED: basic salivary proline-rich protein 2-like [Lupinus angustifolius]OIW00380.1 hypothetical protein TanjilG_05730 [Lupinus angustifolius]